MKSCKISIEQNLTQSELFQPGHDLRLDLHTALEPGSEILQDPKLSKSCSKSELSQPGQEPHHDLHAVKLLNSPYFHHSRLSAARDCLYQKLITVKYLEHAKLKHYGSIVCQNNYLKLSECNGTSHLHSNSVYLSYI